MGSRGKVGLTCATLALWGVVTTMPAHGASVDWKYYGGASVDGISQCFYDANGVDRLPMGHVRAWTKCLTQTEIDKVDIQKDYDGKILDSTAKKISQYYIPPIGVVENLNTDQIMTIAQYEETADISLINPQSSIFYEFDCHGKMIRELSIHIETKVSKISQDKPTDWRYLPPEGSGATLSKLLCAPE